MTMRGAIMRTISVGSNLLLLALVSPAELGLLAVARGTFVLLQYLAELGMGKAMLRRPVATTAPEYAALAGLQLLVTAIVVTIGSMWPALVLGFGAIDGRWHLPMLGTVASMAFIAFGAGARVRLERSLSYERLATVDVLNVLLLNIGLVIAALLHQFSLGVFIVLGVSAMTNNLVLYRLSPGPAPSWNLKPLAGVARDASGFLLASTGAVLREQGTPVLIGVLFGLPIAGLYSFAERVAQVLNVAFDGFRNAAIPAASRLANDVRSLRALASRTLAVTASLTAPLAVLAVCGLPILAQLVPRWSEAVVLAQWYVVVYAVYGVVIAAMEPSALSFHGARAAMSQQFAALAAGWLGFAAVSVVGPSWLALGVGAMYAAPVVALWVVSSPEIRPQGSRELAQIGAGFTLGMLAYAGLRVAGAPLWLTVLVPASVAIGFVPRWRALPARIRAGHRRRRALA